MTSRTTVPLLLILASAIPVGAEEARPARDYRGLMREFVIAISEQAKARRPGFLVVPQGGLELLEIDEDRPAAAYLKAIDGVGQEEVFYGYGNEDDLPTPAEETREFLRLLGLARQSGKAVLATDYTSKREQVDDAYKRSSAAGFLPFAAHRRGLDAIPTHPAQPWRAGSRDVAGLADAANFLFFINGGRYESREAYLAAAARTGYDVLIVDPFTGPDRVDRASIDALKRKPDGGRRLVLCYVSIGEAEDYRTYWKPSWKDAPPPFLGAENPDWEGNYAVRYWDPSWKRIILDGPDSSIARVLEAGFDGVYLDKVDEFDWFEQKGE